MSQVQFGALDLNLFRVLLALLERRSVTLAAEDLGLTASAVSHALNRLRDALDDPLFERRGGRLEPTPYALEVGQRARPAVEGLRQAIGKTAFNPRKAEREFVLAAGSYAAVLLLPALVRRLQSVAPGVRLRVRRIEEHFAEDLERGRSDIAIAGANTHGRGLAWRPLMTDQLVWVARADHPFLREPVTKADLRRARHVVVDKLSNRLAENDKLRGYMSELSELSDAYSTSDWNEASGNVAAIVPDIAQAIEIVRRTDCVTLTMRDFALAQAGADLQVLTPPASPQPLELGLVFREERLRDLGFAWLVDQMSAP